MKRISLALAAIAVLTLGGPAAQAKQYIVKYRGDAGYEYLQGLNMKTMDRHAKGHLLKVDIPERVGTEVLVQLFSNPNVEYVVPNFQLRAYLNPVNLNMNSLRSQWAVEKVQAEKAWQRAGNKGSKKIVVAVIDTGADYNHPALKPNMVQGFNFKDNNSDPMDKTSFQNPGHGTHCSGIIGATGLADGGTVGLSPDVSIMPLRFLDENGSGDLMDSVKAIDYAVSKNVSVISASWGAAVKRSEAQPLIEAIDRAGKAGIPFVVAAANDGKNNDDNEYYPTNAGTDNTIAVAATGSSDQKPSWSNFGRAKVAVASPGENIISTLPNGNYGELSGTSMATPLVAGLVALIRAQDPKLTPLEIRSLLEASGDKVNVEVACDCRVNAFTAIDMVKGRKMYVSPNAGTINKGETVRMSAVYGQPPLTFTSSNPSVASVDANGILTGVAEGDVTISVKDGRGQTATSYKIYVGIPQSNGGGGGGGGGLPDPGNPGGGGGGGSPFPDPNNPGGGGGGAGQCPLDPQTCQAICQMQPDLPFCQH